MSTTATTTAPVRTDRLPVWKHGIGAAVVASVATTAIAAVASTAGVSFAGPDGSAIPLLGFAQLTMIFSLIAVGIAAVLARRARHPRSTFVRTCVALLVLSIVPDLTFGFDAASAAVLILTHVAAAAIVVPVLARRLADN
ncbi:Uncharacterised protein (plasmid) [Tsukamurella tyrosinosolvens]|uniref:Cell envelope biogenesis protein OmpA n=1 Tax=Tsukamurella tyrosinosolvens TaxID=57704 RepID=A0A1H4N912_TSUTY|nr:DUF6069 family protein [Tsukamurella tyrosinosolvens]KXO97064.1 cell envelope biogenesis protein OmpA [Tsukamurella tyrosinosolvens]SEB91733.1 hypothetical protein SAMN04489793_1096 [Tsukamurella tyrosinosolvens]VEI00366.1 Uncharacterised protein [Tsukamurella tyrosinosolvens]